MIAELFYRVAILIYLVQTSVQSTETLSLPKASAEYDSFYSNVYHVIREGGAMVFVKPTPA